MGGKCWFTAAELAELRLPGLPTTKRKINEDWAPLWSVTVDAYGALLSRPRQARGGGLEFHINVLPAAARSALVKRGLAGVADVSDDPPASEPTTASELLWRNFERQSAEVKAAAQLRLDALHQVERFEATGLTRTVAIASTADLIGKSTATIWQWIRLVAGADRSDWLPLLAPCWTGGGKTAEVHPDVWRFFESDYLRAEPVTIAAAYRATKKFAEKNGLPMPQERTLRRKAERDIDPRLLLAKRKGPDAVKALVPPVPRSVAAMHALQAVNIDGHRWDIRCRWPNGRIGRPMMVAVQDVYSRKILAWRIDEEETALSTRLVYADLVATYGIPSFAFHDNSRAFSSKLITGGRKTNRHRYKDLDKDPAGILTALGVKVIFTTPYHGQAKPIERAFRDLEGSIGVDPELAGFHTGNSPANKPHNFDETKAIAIERFREIVAAGIAEHNARQGRNTEAARGRSFDDAFNESYAASTIKKATEMQARMALLAIENRPTDRNNGSIRLHGHVYWCEELNLHLGERLTVRFDPDNLRLPIHVYDAEDRFLCSAPVIEAAPFLDVATLKRQQKLRKDVRKTARELEEKADLQHAEELAAALAASSAPVPAPVPQPGAVRMVVHGNTALKPVPNRPLRPRSEAAQAASLDRMAAGMARLRAVK